MDLVSLQDLVCLFQIYLTPLQTETFLSEDEVNAEKPFRLVFAASNAAVSPSDGGVVRQSARHVGLPESFPSNAGGQNRLLSQLQPPGNTWTVPGELRQPFGTFPVIFSACF